MFFFLCSCTNHQKDRNIDSNNENKKSLNSESQSIYKKKNINYSFITDEIVQYIPDSMTVLDTAFGDLNLDNFKDLIIVLKTKNEEIREDLMDNPNRPLLIFVAIANNQFKFLSRNDNIVKCFSCGGTMGDPYVDIVIKNGYFSVEHYGGSRERWTQITTFKYDKSKNDFFLHRDSEEVIDILTSEDNPKTISSTNKTKKDFGIVKFSDYKYNF